MDAPDHLSANSVHFLLIVLGQNNGGLLPPNDTIFVLFFTVAVVRTLWGRGSMMPILTRGIPIDVGCGNSPGPVLSLQSVEIILIRSSFSRMIRHACNREGWSFNTQWPLSFHIGRICSDHVTNLFMDRL